MCNWGTGHDVCSLYYEWREPSDLGFTTRLFTSRCHAHPSPQIHANPGFLSPLHKFHTPISSHSNIVNLVMAQNPPSKEHPRLISYRFVALSWHIQSFGSLPCSTCTQPTSLHPTRPHFHWMGQSLPNSFHVSRHANFNPQVIRTKLFMTIIAAALVAGFIAIAKLSKKEDRMMHLNVMHFCMWIAFGWFKWWLARWERVREFMDRLPVRKWRLHIGGFNIHLFCTL